MRWRHPKNFQFSPKNVIEIVVLWWIYPIIMSITIELDVNFNQEAHKQNKNMIWIFRYKKKTQSLKLNFLVTPASRNCASRGKWGVLGIFHFTHLTWLILSLISKFLSLIIFQLHQKTKTYHTFAFDYFARLFEIILSCSLYYMQG